MLPGFLARNLWRTWGSELCRGAGEAVAEGHLRVQPPRPGGFLGFWWNNEDIEGGEIYLQLEEDALVAKIWAETPDRRGELREGPCHASEAA